MPLEDYKLSHGKAPKSSIKLEIVIIPLQIPVFQIFWVFFVVIRGWHTSQQVFSEIKYDLSVHLRLRWGEVDIKMSEKVTTFEINPGYEKSILKIDVQKCF